MQNSPFPIGKDGLSQREDNLSFGRVRRAHAVLRVFSAFSRHRTRTFSSKGFFKYPYAPAFSTRARIFSLSKAVMKIIGVKLPSAINCA